MVVSMDDVELMKLYHHIGLRVKLRRSLLHATQEDIADRLNITVCVLDKIERGAIRISAPTLLAYAGLTHTPILWFFEGLSPLDGSGKPVSNSDVVQILFGRSRDNSPHALLKAA